MAAKKTTTEQEIVQLVSPSGPTVSVEADKVERLLKAGFTKVGATAAKTSAAKTQSTDPESK